jgi:ribose transport system ATP-binding protein
MGASGTVLQEERPSRGTAVLHVEHLSKSFGNTHALVDVQFEVFSNELVAIVGQNGAGKSTLTKILVGVEHPDAGTITYNGQPFAPADPLDAARKGISMVYQEGSIVADLKAFQWLFLGRELGSGFALSSGQMKKKTEEVFMELNIDCPPDVRLRSLDPVTSKMVEIAKAFEMMGESRSTAPVIILDEPTAPLTLKEREVLFAKITELKQKASFIFISHLIPEVIRIADRVVVLRDGKNAGFFLPRSATVTPEMVFEGMTGKHYQKFIKQKAEQQAGEPILALKVNNIGRHGAFHDVSFTLSKGEVLCLMGLPNSGKIEIVKAVAGILNIDEGSFEKGGKELPHGVHRRIKSGVMYVSGQRVDEIMQSWPIRKNLSVARLDNLKRRLAGILPIINSSQEYEDSRGMIDKLKIRGNSDMEVGNLSGGNMQKVALGKLLEVDPDIFLLDNVTVGVDVGTKEDFYGMVIQLKIQGKSFIVISDDPDEIDRLADRRITVEDGTIKEG